MMQYLRNLLRKNRFIIRGTHQIEIADDAYRAMKKVRIKVRGKNNRLVILPGVQLTHTEVRLDGENNTLILDRDCAYRSGKIYIKAGQGSTVHIGAATTVEGAYLLAEEGADILIGNDCMLSTDIMIRTGDKHSVIDQETGLRTNPVQDIKLGNHVWIGRSVTLLKGVEILDDSIVAAHAVVTKSATQPNSCLAGNPARTVKQGINWLRERI